jgi:hypothetical protein
MTQIKTDEEPVKFETVGDDTYIGYPLLSKGLDTDEPVWGIKRVGATGITYPEGSKMKKFVWEDKADYDYFPFASKGGE